MAKGVFRWLAPTFRRPQTKEGARLRKEAAAMSNARTQQTYISNLTGSDKQYREGSSDMVHRVARGDTFLREFGAREIAKHIRKYNDPIDPSGSSGEWLTRICARMDIDLGDLLATGADEKAILALVDSQMKKLEKQNKTFWF